MTKPSTHAIESARRVAADPDTFLGRMHRLRLKVASSNGVAKGEYTITTGTRVSFDPDRFPEHDEKSLAKAITEVVKGLNSGYARGTTEVQRQSGGIPGTDPLTAASREEYERLVGEIDLVESSPRTEVKVRMRGRGGTEVKIRPGTLAQSKFTHEILAADVNTALDRAAEKFALAKRRARETAFDRAE